MSGSKKVFRGLEPGQLYAVRADRPALTRPPCIDHTALRGPDGPARPCMDRPARTARTPRVARIFLTQLLCVTYRNRVHAWLKVFAVRMSYLSISPSPFSCFIRRPCCSRTVTSRPHSRLHRFRRTVPDLNGGQAHFRTRGEEFGYLADPTHSTGYEPMEFDKVTSVDGDNDPNHDSISEFSETTRESTGLFGVPIVFEASVSQVSHGGFALQREKQRKHASGNHCKTERDER